MLPKRRPAATRFQISNLELGNFFQYPVGTKIHAGEQLLQRMAGDVPAKFAITIRTGLFQHGARALMDADRHAEVGGGFINRKVIGARQRAAAQFIGPPENADMAQLLLGVFQFFDRPRRVLQRNQAHAVKPLRIIAAIVG